MPVIDGKSLAYPSRHMKMIPLFLAGCLTAFVATGHATDAPYQPFGVDLTARDLTTRPGMDFWQYANGAWEARTAIPADREATGVVGGMAERAALDVQGMLETLANHPRESDGAAARKAGDMYAAWMDVAGIERRGLAPLRSYQATIDAIHDRESLARVLGTGGFASPLVFGSMVDPRDASHYAAFVGQGDLGMPRDYYFLAGANYDAGRAAYRNYVARIFSLAGFAHPASRAAAVVTLETRLAKAQWPTEALRDPAKGARIETVSSMEASMPGVDWASLLRASPLSGDSAITVTQPGAVDATAKIVAATPLQDWKDYLAFRFASDHADALPHAFAEAHADFYSTTLYGLKTHSPRATSGVNLINHAMGDAVGQLYMRQHFPDAARRQAQELIEDLRSAYADLIRRSAWMDDVTKQAALAKLRALKANVGGPETAQGYESLRIDCDDPLGNLVRSASFDRATDLARIGRPVDRDAWVTSPQFANGFYDPSSNQMYFAAALLQPPLLDPHADPAVNYGAIGAFIGHEIGHAFDDQGARYDANGKVENWWTDASRKRFETRAAAIAAQYGATEALPGATVNGSLTMGENMADLSGAEAALLAYEKYQARHGKAPVIHGMTGEQRFFLANAQLRRSKVREATARQLLLFDTHSPSRVRANGVVRNMDAWYEAFNVRTGDALYLEPSRRLHVW